MAINWKIIALVFISLFLVETIAVAWLFLIGSGVLQKESECAWHCGEKDLFYAIEGDICVCVDGDMEVIDKYLMD